MSERTKDALGPGFSPSGAGHNGRILRRLFLTLFLRGRAGRTLAKNRAPKSIGRKLMSTLLLYVLIGVFAAAFLHQSVFLLSAYLHAMTFVFVGMFVSGSAGEVLFNEEEADILLHRPVSPRALLWAKVAVLVQVSWWLAGAFNLTGLLVGMRLEVGGWRYPLAHLLSTGLLALFCTGGIVLVYQLCLRWLGRERLESLMTMAQVLIAVGIILGSQAMPYLIGRFGQVLAPESSNSFWWAYALPPAWFAALDDALAGSGSPQSWMQGGFGVFVTACVVGLAFGKLSGNYYKGLQQLHEMAPRASRSRRRRWLSALGQSAVLPRLMPDSVTRGSFLLTLAYLTRDRDVKLRIYPGLAPMVIIPLVFLLRDISQDQAGGTSGFGVAFAGGYFGVIPYLGLSLMQYTQHWQAAELFRTAPLRGPAQLCHGARWGVLVFLAVPLFLVLTILIFVAGQQSRHWPLLFPGLMLVPVYGLIPCLRGKAVPLSRPIEEGKSAGQGLTMMGVLLISLALAGLSLWAYHTGWFLWFLLVEGVGVTVCYGWLRASVNRAKWNESL